MTAQRTPPGSKFDVFLRPPMDGVFINTGDPIHALATRPDRGQWLVSIPLTDFLRMLDNRAEVEVKRYKKFSHHTIFEGKFNG